MKTRAFVASGMCVVMLFSARAVSAQTASFENFVKSYYEGEYAAHPGAATSVGIHDYDSRVADLRAAGQARNSARLREAPATLRAMDPHRLSSGDRDDRE